MKLTPRELAREAGVRPQMIFNYLADKRIPGIRDPEHGGRWMITREDADVWLQQRADKAEAKQNKIKAELAEIDKRLGRNK